MSKKDSNNTCLLNDLIVTFELQLSISALALNVLTLFNCVCVIEMIA